MSALGTWIRSLVFYLIFMTFVTNLLPGKTYDRYFKLFTGMVLILLAVKPLTGGLELEERLARTFQSVSFQNEAGELKGQMEDLERKRLERLIGKYEEAVSQDVEERLEREGYGDAKAQVRINENQESQNFGALEELEINLGNQRTGVAELGEESTGEQERGKGAEKDKDSVLVSPIKVDVLENASSDSEAGTLQKGSLSEKNEETETEQPEELYGQEGSKSSSSQVSAPALSGSRETERIRKEIADFYGVEESHVKIQVGNR